MELVNVTLTETIRVLLEEKNTTPCVTSLKQ